MAIILTTRLGNEDQVQSSHETLGELFRAIKRLEHEHGWVFEAPADIDGVSYGTFVSLNAGVKGVYTMRDA